MQIKVFETFQANQRGQDDLNTFLAGEGRSIVVREIFTAAAATESTCRHFVTIVYDTLEQAPPIE